MKTSPFLWVALDGLTDEDPSQTFRIARQLDLEKEEFGFKVNLDWVLRHGMRRVSTNALFQDRQLFVDLKMWNGARTMAQVFCDMADANVSVVNAYALAGGYGQRNAQLKEAIERFRSKRPSSKMRIYAVTVLTHYSDEYCERHFGKTLLEEVCDLAQEGIAAGADGVIGPGSILTRTSICKTKISPGLRTPWYRDERHAQELQLQDIAGRPDFEVVCGGPIMKHSDHVWALHKILSALRA